MVHRSQVCATTDWGAPLEGNRLVYPPVLWPGMAALDRWLPYNCAATTVRMCTCGCIACTFQVCVPCRDATGKFPEFPDLDEGGSLAIFKQRVEGGVSHASMCNCACTNQAPTDTAVCACSHLAEVCVWSEVVMFAFSLLQDMEAVSGLNMHAVHGTL